jgi:hypothetical protein
MSNDIFGQIIRNLAEAWGVGDDARVREEVRIRQQFGGEKHYIAKKLDMQRAVALGERMKRGESVEQASKSAGIARSTGYRLSRRRFA